MPWVPSPPPSLPLPPRHTHERPHKLTTKDRKAKVEYDERERRGGKRIGNRGKREHPKHTMDVKKEEAREPDKNRERRDVQITSIS